jgi:hypothetical protein
MARQELEYLSTIFAHWIKQTSDEPIWPADAKIRAENLVKFDSVPVDGI